MSRKEFGKHEDGDGTLLPLVDVVFILVIALATRVSDDTAITVQLAEVSGDKSQRQAKSEETLPIVELAANGRVSLGGTIVTQEQLVPRIQPLLAASDRRLTLLRVDRDAKYQDVVTVRKLITSAGINVRELGRLED